MPFVRLRQKFLEIGIELNTADVNAELEVCFELHLDAHRSAKSSHPKYAILFETPLIQPQNQNQDLLRQYQTIFTWDDRHTDGQRWQKVNFPNVLQNPPIDGYPERKKLCVMIAANKSIRRSDPRELYSQRAEAILWFESNALHDFSLYGVDWHLPIQKSGLWGKMLGRFHRYSTSYLPAVVRPSYCGKVERKCDVLKHSRFSICYENASGFDGYITEKIFDCLNSGCIPVYWGADNISQYIPPSCFIDKRSYSDLGELYQYMKNMPESDFLAYQNSIAVFLAGSAASAFSVDRFVETLFNHISADVHVAA